MTETYVIVQCEFCGKDHTELMIDGHIAQPHLCEECWRSVLRELEKEET